MGAAVLHDAAIVFCEHGGQARPLLRNPRVSAGGRPIVTLTCVYAIAGCTLPPPPAGNGPCATATWLTAATRVTAGGLPVLLRTSQAQCVPTGASLRILAHQQRVTAV
jgi:hypothetical protein